MEAAQLNGDISSVAYLDRVITMLDQFEFEERRQLFISTRNKPLPSPRCAFAIQIVRPFESIAEMQPQLQPALLRLSAIISQYFTSRLCAFTSQQAT